MSKQSDHCEFKYAVKYLGGIAQNPTPIEGSLALSGNLLTFSQVNNIINIPIETVVDITTTETDDTVKAVGSYVALGMFGLAATRSMSKNRVMRIVFKNQQGDLQTPDFKFLPKNVKEVNFIEDARLKLIAKRQKNNVQYPPINSTENKEQQCKSCGSNNNSNALFCKRCGHALDDKKEQTNSVFCDQCGSSNRAEAKYCRKCGLKLCK